MLFTSCKSCDRRRLGIALVLCGLLCSVISAWAAENQSAEQYVSKLESSYREVRGLRAEFTQTHMWGGRKRFESGTVYFARGGLMRWEYREPSEKLFLSDGKRLYLYLPAMHQLNIQPVKQSDDMRVPFRLLLSRVNLRRVFARFELDKQETNTPTDGRVLRGFPKSADQEGYEEVVMEISPELDVNRLLVRYVDNSTMEFTFSSIARNPAINSALFRFVPPAGTEIIEKR